MTIDEVIEWVGQSWILLTGAVAVVGVLISFIKQLKEIKAAMLRPMTDIQNKLDNLDSKQEMQNRAVLTLQRRSLLDSCERLLKQGYADLKDKEVIEKQFESYTELGGNSFVKDLVARVLVKNYLNPKGTEIYDGQIATGMYYNGPTLTGVNTRYASDKNWANAVYKWMTYLYDRL